jgi:hypothetical protein
MAAVFSMGSKIGGKRKRNFRECGKYMPPKFLFPVFTPCVETEYSGHMVPIADAILVASVDLIHHRRPKKLTVIRTSRFTSLRDPQNTRPPSGAS